MFNLILEEEDQYPWELRELGEGTEPLNLHLPSRSPNGEYYLGYDVTEIECEREGRLGKSICVTLPGPRLDHRRSDHDIRSRPSREVERVLNGRETGVKVGVTG